MGRYKSRMSADYQTENYNPDLRYDLAYKRVKRIKGFYIHFIVYSCVNIFIVFVNINNLEPGESYFKMENFFTAFFWGIGLTAHGFSVFSRNIFFGKNWEERKIQELMEKEKTEKWE